MRSCPSDRGFSRVPETVGRMRIWRRGQLGTVGSNSGEASWLPFLLSLHPNFVTCNPPGAVSHRINLGDSDLTRNRFNNPQKLKPYGIGGLAGDGRSVDLINKAAPPVGQYGHTNRMRVAVYRFVVIVDPKGRKKQEHQYQGNHYIVLNRAAFVGPENVAPNCPPDVAHRHRGCVGCYRGCVNPVQV